MGKDGGEEEWEEVTEGSGQIRRRLKGRKGGGGKGCQKEGRKEGGHKGVRREV